MIKTDNAGQDFAVGFIAIQEKSTVQPVTHPDFPDIQD